MAFAAPSEEVEEAKSQGFSAPASEVEGFSAPAHELDSTSIADPIEHAASNYDNPAEKEAAFNVYKQQAKQPTDVMGGVGRFIKGAAGTIFPSVDAQGNWQWPLGSGIKNLAVGTYQTAKNIADTQGNPLNPITPVKTLLGGPLLTAAENYWNEDPTASRAGRQLAAGTQEGMLNAAQMTGNLRRNLSAATGTLTNGAVGANAQQLSDADLRQRFDDEAHYRYLSKQVQQGILPSEAESGQTTGPTPQDLAKAGAPVDPQTIQNIATATNPANLVELGGLTAPITQRLTAPLVSAAGRAVTGAANLVDKAHLGSLGRTAGVLEGLYHGNPLGVATAVAAPLASKAISATGRAAGDLLTGAGDEMAGGQIPLGQSAAAKVAKETIKGAVGSLPTAAVFSATGENPEEAGSRFFNAVGLGTILSAASAIPKSGASGAIERTAAGQQLASEGATTNFGTGYDAWHQEAMQSVPPQDANEINKYRGFLGRLRTPDGKPIQVYAVKGDKFGAVQKSLGEVDAQGNPTNPNGRGLISPDGSQVFVNVDAPGNVNDPLGHETGHAADLVGQYANSLLSQSLQSNIAQHLYTTDPQGNVLPTKDFADFMDNYQKAVGAKQMSREQFESEYVAETARKILGGQNIENFTLPKSLSEKVKGGVSSFLQNIGIQPQDGKLGFGGKEIQAITQNVSDLLRQPTPDQPAPTSADYRIDQLKTVLANPPGRGATVEQLDQFAAAKKEYADLLKKKDFSIPTEFPASGRAPVPPSAPAVPTRTAAQTRVAAALRLNGIPAAEAAQWASVAQGGTVEAMIVDALQKRAQQKFPTTPTTPNVQPTPAIPLEPVPAGQREVSAGNPIVTQTTPQVEQQTAVTQQPVKTAEEVKALVDDAGQKAAEKERNPNTKAAKDRIQRATVGAVLDDIGDNPTGLHREVDQFGNEKIVGDYDPTDPRQKALADMGGLSDQDAQKLQNLQANKGNIQYIRYRSALSSAEGGGGEGTLGTGMDTRRAEYALDPAAERTQGTIQHKVMIPVGTQMHSPSGRITSQFVVLDNVLHNFASISEGLKGIGRPNPYGETAKEQESLLVQDTQAYAENHAHGYKGDGSGPMKTFPDSGLPAVDPNYTPQVIPADRFAVLNMAFANEAAGKLENQKQKLAEAQSDLATETTASKKAAKQRTINRLSQSVSQAQELYALGAQNAPWVDHQTGETNQLRAEMKAAGFDTDKQLKSPFENLSPQHILETSDQPIPLRDGDIPSARPTGFDVDPAKLAAKGLPQSKAVGAGFLPAEKEGVNAIMDEWESRGIKSHISENGDRIILHSIIVPPGNRQSGVGSSALAELTNYADQNGKTITLSPSTDFGASSVNRLRDFYKRFGFVDNRGKNKDFSISDTMIRSPKMSAFMPTENTPEGEPKAPGEGQPPQGEPSINPSSGVTSKEDSGKPEEGATPAERLAREAEEAGVMLSMATLRAMIRDDPDTMNKIRARIEAATGKPARFLPHAEPERIAGTANLMSDGSVVTGDLPNSIHASIESKFEDEQPDSTAFTKERGFITSMGRFVGREEAAQIAKSGIKSMGAEHLTKSGRASPRMLALQRQFDSEDKAKFQPASPYNPPQDTTPILDPRAPAFENRFELLSHKEGQSGLNPKEEEEISRLQRLITRKYGSFMAYARKKDN